VEILDEDSLIEATKILADRDPDLASIMRQYGIPPLWFRTPGFNTLLHIILEQQVSLSSARAAYNRLEKALGEVTPKKFLTLSDEELKTIGFSRQKTRYGRLLAQDIIEGRVNLDALKELPDEEARDRLMKLKGIGCWSADIYLLMALRRPDIWPHNDIALVKTVSKIKGLSKSISSVEWEKVADAWRPWRSVAARMAWYDYLGGKA
jgi:DNA-3-methyladenine glycosylase II